MLKDKLLGGITIALFTVGIGCIGYVLYNNMKHSSILAQLGNMECVQKNYTYANADKAIEAEIALGTPLMVMANYYQCNQIARDQMVQFRFSQSIEPSVRFVRGLPGDKYLLEKSSDSNDQWHIQINGSYVMNGQDKFYIRSNHTPALKTYSDARNGILGPNEYILLATNPPSISDSSNMGLIKKESIVGRVVKGK